MPAETAEPYRIRLVVHRTDDALKARWIEPEGQESDSFPSRRSVPSLRYRSRC